MPRGRKPTCECGDCRKCEMREYGRAWRERHPSYMRDYSRDYLDAKDPGRIARRQKKASDHHWTPEEDKYLGTDTDKAVGATLGRSWRSVHKRRVRLGVPAYIKRGRRLNHKGYAFIVLEPNDPLIEMTRSDRSVAEHRLVMAHHLGRPLTRDEVVHHRNGIRTDNRLSNLELWTRAHPTGQRVDDVFEWCVEFIERYARELDEASFSVEYGA